MLPYIILGWMQVLWNAALIACLLWGAWTLVAAVRADIDIKVDEYKRQVVSEIESCARQFRENRCQPGTRIPAMQDMCERWEK